MAELTDEMKVEIVTRLACFEDIGEVVKDFLQRDIEVSHKQIGTYDPTKAYFKAGDWARELFEQTRKAYCEDSAAVPCSKQGYRLNILQRGIEAAVKSRNWVLAASLSEQASKEVGGAFTNTRELSVNDSRRAPRAMSPEERREVFADIVREAIEKMPPVPGQEPQHLTQQ